MFNIFCDVFLEVGRLKVLEPEGIYQNRTRCNGLSPCIAWPVVERREMRQSVERRREPADFAVTAVVASNWYML